MTSRIIKVEEGVISRSRRLRPITLTETLIFLDMTKPNLIIVLLYSERKKKMVTTVSETDNLFLKVLKKTSGSLSFFLFHVISKRLVCHLRRPFCVLWVLSSTIFFLSCSVNKQNLEVMFLLLHWRQPTHSARIWLVFILRFVKTGTATPLSFPNIRSDPAP